MGLFAGFVGIVICGYIYCCYRIYKTPRRHIDLDSLLIGITFYSAEDDYRFTSRFMPNMQHMDLDIDRILGEEDDNEEEDADCRRGSSQSQCTAEDSIPKPDSRGRCKQYCVRVLFLVFELASLVTTAIHLALVFAEMHAVAVDTVQATSLNHTTKAEACLASIMLFYVLFLVSFMFWPLSAIYGYRYYGFTIVGLVVASVSSCGLFASSMILWTWRDWKSWLLTFLVINSVVFDMMWWGYCWWKHYGRLQMYRDFALAKVNDENKMAIEMIEAPLSSSPWAQSHAYV